MVKFYNAALAILALLAISLDFVTSVGHGTTDAEWNAYKRQFGKVYPNAGITEAYARYYYTYNKKLIDNHNAYYARGLKTFGLRANQFTDMRLVTFNSLFPVVTQPAQSSARPLPPAQGIADLNFDPVEDLGFNFTVGDQGTVCNSGWAYATAKAVEMLQAYQTGIFMPPALSAQNLIDCAGRSGGCTNQVPQTGFDYLAVNMQELHLASAYPANKEQAQQGMCLLPGGQQQMTTRLQSYGHLNDGDDAALRSYLPTYPVVVEFNPASFEFMHYSEGIFQQPLTYRGSHFMTAMGYGRNATSNLDYFILQNSFNTTWGENGRIRIAYTPARPLTKSAILPIDL